MSHRRVAVQHVKLNLLKKSQIKGLNKNGVSSSLKDRQSLNLTLTLEEEERSLSSSSQMHSIGDKQENQSNEESPIENVEVSQFSYNKLCLIEKKLFFSTITQVFFGFLLVEIETRSPGSPQHTTLLILMSLVSVLVAMLVLLRKILELKLKIDQKLVYHYNGWKLRRYFSPGFVALISSRGLVLQTIIELGIGFVHPNIFTNSALYTTYDDKYQVQIFQSFNNILGVLMVSKLFLILRSLINLTKFVTPRVIRVCNMSQLDYSLMYSIKCIQKEYPIRSIFITVSLVLVMFGYGFRVAEGTVINYNKLAPNGFEELVNCLWFAFQTMYTIGYGQYMPRTDIGRFLAACLSVLGIGTNSILLVSVFDYLEMKNQEEKSLTLIHRMENRQLMQKQASWAVKIIAEISQLMDSFKCSSSQKLKCLKELYEKVKFHMDETKKYRLQIKNLIPLNDQTETMIYFFIRLRENFAEVCKNQISVQILLQNDKLRDGNIRRSIGEHFKSFINKTLTVTPSMSVREI